MNMQEALDINVLVFWWNMGRKTKDFVGTFRDFLKKKEIKYRKVAKGYRFQIEVSSIKVNVLFTNMDTLNMVGETAILFTTMMGDKATVSYQGRCCRINW